MKFFVYTLPLAVILLASCQKNQPAATLPPVVQQKKVANTTSKTKKTSSKPKKKKTYRKPTTKTKSKPKPSSTTGKVISENRDTLTPLNPDPVNVSGEDVIPNFAVPENIQPKVEDGINQGLFIELKY